MPATPEHSTPAASAADVATTPANEPAPDAPKKLTVILDDDGRIVADAMRSATKEKLTTALKDPTLLPRLGISGGGAAAMPAADTLFDFNVCAILYGAAGSIMSAVMVKSGYPVDQVLAVVPFSADEVSTLAPLTGKVLDKWIPMSGKYKDEAMLGLALFGIVNAKLAQLKKPGTVHPFPVTAAAPDAAAPAYVAPADRPGV